MIDKKLIKKATSIVGIFCVIGWVFAGDDIIGTMLLMFSIMIASGLHLLIVDEDKAPGVKKKTKEEIMRDNILAQLKKENKLDVLDVPPEPPNNYIKPVEPEQVILEEQELPALKPLQPQAIDALTSGKPGAVCPVCGETLPTEYKLKVHLNKNDEAHSNYYKQRMGL